MVNSVYQILFECRSKMRESTERTRKRILEAAAAHMLQVGYQKASMRKIAADAGLTAGALYKHFPGKEEIFEEICDEIIERLFAMQKKLLPDNLEERTDEELLQLFRQKASVQMLYGFKEYFPMLQMIVLHGNPEYYARKKAEYLDFSVFYAVRYYDELYRRGLTKKKYSTEEVYMLSQAEFLALCTFLESTEHEGSMEESNVRAYETLLRIVQLGIQADSGIAVQ